MKKANATAELARIDLSFLLDEGRTPDGVIRFFLELSDYCGAHAQVLKVNRSTAEDGALDLIKRLVVRDLFLYSRAVKEHSRSGLLLHSMPQPSLWKWPVKYKAFLHFIKKKRVPVLLIPRGALFRPFRKVLAIESAPSLPVFMEPLSDCENLQYSVFSHNRLRLSTNTYQSFRFDETGYSRQSLQEEKLFDAFLRNKPFDLVVISPGIPMPYWRTLLNGSTPVLVNPDKTVEGNKEAFNFFGHLRESVQKMYLNSKAIG